MWKARKVVHFYKLIRRQRLSNELLLRCNLTQKADDAVCSSVYTDRVKAAAIIGGVATVGALYYYYLTTSRGKLDKSNVVVLLGAQWGDEGKGKIIDHLLEDKKFDVVARCQGGNNAGHTVCANGKNYDFHMLPCGMPIKGCLNIIGNGVVLNVDALFKELEHNGRIDDVEWKNRSDWEDRLFISDRAHLVLRVHMLLDDQQENSLDNKSKIGTTRKGIGPTYASKCFRNGLRVADLLGDFDEFSKKYRILIKQFANIEIDEEDELSSLKKNADRLRRFSVVDSAEFLYERRNQGKSILVEGANGALLDIDFGTYPYVTSSNSTVGGACTGLGLPPTSINSVIGVVKAYQTRVGSGPFPTELLNSDKSGPDKIGSKLQAVGHEIGVTTGRPRRCGWLDLVLLRYATMIDGFTELALTKIDVLDEFEEIQVAVEYKSSDGLPMEGPPANASDWDNIEVTYRTFPGWKTPTADVRNYADLPENCRNYIEFIESFVRVKISLIGVGKSRECLIIKKNC